MGGPHALDVRGLEVGYGRVQVLRGVALCVGRGELVTIVGPNGAGKTTLLRAMMGLVPIRAGSVTFDGGTISGWSTESISRLGIAMVPEGRDLFGPLTALENLALGAYRHPRAARRRAAAGDLARVLALFPSLSGRLDQRAATLSGGEQQMLAMGRALMARPRLLLLDEPSVGLAPLVIGEIFRALAALKAEGLTILLVEQNARAAFRIADRGYALMPGGDLVETRISASDTESARRAYGLGRVPEESPL
jgi:branched-chain amino acid transport system ATP-binding protein